jgi:hypothetical protein
MLALTGVDLLRCPRCTDGRLVPVALPPTAATYGVSEDMPIVTGV